VAPPRRPWRGGFEFGVNGSDGNSDVLSLRFGSNFDAKVERNAFHMDVLYTFTQQDGTTRQNQAILNARDEILFPGSPWSIFSATQVEYDQFRAYDLRAGAYAGFSYRWIKTDDTSFKTRVGAGAVREIDTRDGGPPDRWVPEAVVGGDFNHRFTDRQAFVSGVDVFPNLSQLGQFRVRARAGYEIVLDPTRGMVLRLGVQDRYDSNPGPARRNDLNYFATLLFRF
jgi:putative salt-induced outer membrane protein YdiY